MVSYKLVTNAEDLGQVANEIDSAVAVGLDIETTALNPVDGEIRLVQINTGKNIWVIDLFQTKTLGPVLAAFAQQRAIVIGQNLKFEQRWFLYKFGLELWPIFDTWRASALIYNGYDNLGHNLYDLYRRELRDESEIPDQGLSDWTGTLSPEQLAYAADDVARLFPLRDVLRPKLVDNGLLQVALIEFGAILPEASVENNGIYLHAPSWLVLAEENAKQAELLRQELLYELPNPRDQISLPGFAPSFNLGSPKQMLESFRRLGLPDLPDTKEMTLAMYAGEFPVVSKFLQYREYSKRVEAFGPDYLNHINPKTQCIHTSFYPFTGAGRYASSKPNLQQIPRDPKFRSCFRAEDGKTFILADYGNIEMRIIAEISGDKTLIKVFVDKRDAHYATASLLTGKPESEVLKKERQEAKPVNFGFCIAEGQLVLTPDGLVPIESITCRHLVWDGVEWVSHEGLIDMGVREVITYDGLTATPDHEVYLDAGSRVRFEDAASSLHDGRLAIGAIGDLPIRYDAFDRKVGATSEESSVRRGDLHRLFDAALAFGGQHQGAQDYELLLSASPEVFRSSRAHAGGEVRRDSAALPKRFRESVCELQGERNQEPVHLSRTLHSLGVGDFPDGGLLLAGAGSEEQRRSLRPRQSAFHDVVGEQPEQAPARTKKVRTYDLLNAGPRHRFTVGGKVVSNCYGMQAPKMVLYAQANYGVALTLKKAKEFRQKFFDGYPGIQAWHDRLNRELEACKKSKRSYVARTLGGRLRYLDAEQAYNEIKNTPSQGTGADGLKKALREVYMRLKKYGGTGRWDQPFRVQMRHHVHDEIILTAPSSASAEDSEIRSGSKFDLQNGMEQAMQPFLPRVPVEAEAAEGPTWASK